MSRADNAACRTLLRNGSRTFYMASFLLPGRIRKSASALYAFCRIADDLIDVDGGSLVAIAGLRRRLELAYEGRPLSTPIDRAFADTIREYDIPRELPEGLIEGLEWDAHSRRYETLEDLQAYAVRVAGTVGAMMALLMRASSPELVARACDLGVAMQLTNIARDVGEDGRMSRLYLPASWFDEVGIDADKWLANPIFSPKLQALVSRLLHTADTFYERADPAIAALPMTCRPGIFAARLLYAEIGNELRRKGCDSISERVSVSGRRKIELCCEAFSRFQMWSKPISDDRLDEAQFVIDAIVRAQLPARSIASPSWWNLRGRALRLIDILEQIERRERADRHQLSKTEVIA